nr:hypothetical protein [bacterium]
MLSARAQIADNSKRNNEVRIDVADLVAVMSAILNVFQTKESAKLSVPVKVNIFEVNNHHFHSATCSVAVLNLFVASKVAISFWNSR